MNDAPNTFILFPSCPAICNEDHFLSLKTEIYVSMLEATLNKRHVFFSVQVSDGNLALPGDRCKEEARGNRRASLTRLHDNTVTPGRHPAHQGQGRPQ